LPWRENCRRPASRLAAGTHEAQIDRAQGETMKTTNHERLFVLGLALGFSAVAGAAEFDGTTPLKCTGVEIYSCEPGKACDKVKPQSGTPPVVTIDPANKTVKTPDRADLLPIANSTVNNEQLQFQGTSLKFAWSTIINRKTGKLTLTIADRMGAYVIFGDCKAAGGT
jgi:hypothetical protein